MGVEISGYKTLYVDCDETLVMSDLSAFDREQRITLKYTNGVIDVVPNQKNINLLKLFYKLGYTIIVWSKTGSDWASIVARGIGLDGIAAAYLTKPTFYLDDKDASEWMGPRRYRSPHE